MNPALSMFKKPNSGKGNTMPKNTNQRTITRLFAALALFVGVVGAYGFSPAKAEDTTSTVTIHYNRPDGVYTDWNMWVWFPSLTAEEGASHGLTGSRQEFNGSDSYGKKLTLTFKNMESVKKIGFIVRKDDWTKDVGSDRFITEFDASGNAEIWIRSAIAKVYTGVPCLCAEIYGATQDDYRTVNVSLSEAFSGTLGADNPQGWTISDGLNIVTAVASQTAKTIRTTRTLRLTTDADMELGKTYTISNKRTFNVTNKSLTANIATLTVDQDPSLRTGQTVIVSGVDSTFNGTVKVKAFSSTDGVFTFSYEKTGSTVAATSASGQVETGFGSAPVVIGQIYSSQKFSDAFTYTGNDLGNTYTAAKTDFRVWAPTATAVDVVTYGNAFTPSSITTDGVVTQMTKSVNGTWIATLSGDQHGTIYQYRVAVNGEIHNSIDPYARSAMPNGSKGVVLDLSKTNPSGWNNTKPAFSGRATDASVYEVHVRDMSTDANSGIPDNLKGKYLGMSKLNTSYSTKVGSKTVTTKTGLSAIKELGVTHVQLQPVYDFNSVDETSNAPQFNWGYDPQNFNIPEGSYSTNAYDPISRVKELKTLVQTYHNNGLRVLMDVVYPHVGSAVDFSEQQIVPGYFYRTTPSGELANGSGCGNELASERPMVRKFIIDSLKYWTGEYHMDGYRFDQMGLIDIDTLQGISSAIKSIDPKVITFGEAWNMGDVLPAAQRGMQANLSQIPTFGAFNDQIRDAVKGSTGNAIGRGWITGASYVGFDVQAGITGNTDYSLDLYPSFFTANAGQSVNYVESHDNLTLYDKLKASAPGTNTQLATYVRMAGAVTILAQGMPFQQAGQEFLRSKGGNANSYNAPDAVNQLKWKDRITYAQTTAYYAGLYSIRKQHPAFRMWTPAQIKANLKFVKTSQDVIAYRLNGAAMKDSWKTIMVVHNTQTTPTSVSLPSKGTWNVFVNGASVSADPKKPLKVLKKAFNVIVPPQSTVVVVK